MLAETIMPTPLNNRTNNLARDPINNLIKELRIGNMSERMIDAYVYYNKELLRFANKFGDEINKQDIKHKLVIQLLKLYKVLHILTNFIKFAIMVIWA
jgi:hypothetical protein